jgi:hypothetical protein
MSIRDSRTGRAIEIEAADRPRFFSIGSAHFVAHDWTGKYSIL